MKILLLFLLLFGSCISTSTQKLDPAVYYRNDICFEYKTGEKIKKKRKFFGHGFGRPIYKDEIIKFCGVAVLPYKDSYELKVIGFGKLNFFSLMTCHEEDTSENPGRGIFKKKGIVKIKYKPTLEKDIACPLYVSAYNKKQRHAWGILAFEHPRFQLKANIKCNGYQAETFGVSACQSRGGLIQEIAFDEEVKAVRPTIGAAEKREKCPSITSKDNKLFQFKLPLRECVYQFIGLKSKKIHRYYSIGYESIIIRE